MADPQGVSNLIYIGECACCEKQIVRGTGLMLIDQDKKETKVYCDYDCLREWLDDQIL
jgi:ribosomal protein L24E